MADQEGRKFPVVELFGPTIQGEGAVAGQTSHFVRFGGCGYRCEWCDSMHAVDPDQWQKTARYLTADEIAAELGIFQQAKWVTLTGGDPVIHKLGALVHNLQTDEFNVAVETQGQLWQDWLAMCDQVTVSPKPPSSKQPEPDWKVLGRYVDVCHTNRAPYDRSLCWKVVVFNNKDFDFAEDLHARYPTVPMYLTSGTSQGALNRGDMRVNIIASFSWAAEEFLKRPSLIDVTLFPQLHALIWGSEKGR